MRTLIWWLSLLLLAPLALPLALYTRRTALRLPPAQGPLAGIAGAEHCAEPLRLLVLGESTVVAVGVADNQLGLAAQLAAALAEQGQRPVSWQACGESGITVAQACSRLLPEVLDQPFDLALVVFGVNDSSRLTSLSDWESAVSEIGAALQSRGVAVAFSGLPPLQSFKALPGLLRYLLGGRSALLDARLERLAGRLGAAYLPIHVEFSPAYLAADGYHPSALGYRVWAQNLAKQLLLKGSS